MVHLIFDNWSFRCAFIPLVTVAKSKITRAKILLYFFNCKKIKVVDFHISPSMINKWYETIRRRHLLTFGGTAEISRNVLSFLSQLNV